MIVTKNKKFFVEITTPSELIEYKNDSRFKKFTEEVYDRCVSILDSHEKISSCDLHKELQGLFYYGVKNQSFLNKRFWIIRGYTDEEAAQEISKIQKENALKFVKSVESGKNLHNFSKEYLTKHYTEEELSEKYAENSKRAGITKKNIKEIEPDKYFSSCDTRIEYYVKQGYTEEEAKALVKERQSTFSLEKCIEKYGENEGIARWKERQEKWQNALKSKSQEEIDEMNKKKGITLENMINKYGEEQGKNNYYKWLNSISPYRHDSHFEKESGKLYYIRFYNDDIQFWKIGITLNEVSGGRFENREVFKQKYGLNYEIIFEIVYDSYYEAFQKEQESLSKHEKHRIRINYNGFSTTEAFNVDIIKKENL